MNSKTILKQLILISIVFVVSATFSYGQMCGDVNCDGSVDIIDALLVAQLYVGIIDELSCCTTTPNPTPVFLRGDVNGDGIIDIIDCILITQYLEGLGPVGFNVDAADMNGDGVVDETDRILICDFTLP